MISKTFPTNQNSAHGIYDEYLVVHDESGLKCCSMLQCVAVCCSPMRILVRLVLNWKFIEIISRCCATLTAMGCMCHRVCIEWCFEHAATRCNTLQHTATYRNTSIPIVLYSITLQLEWCILNKSMWLDENVSHPSRVLSLCICQCVCIEFVNILIEGLWLDENVSPQSHILLLCICHWVCVEYASILN